MTQDKAPDWAMETAFRLVPILNGQITEQAHFIALALSQAYERGQESMRERAAAEAMALSERNLGYAEGTEYAAGHFVAAHRCLKAIRSLPIEQEKP